ncbi:hypothetical protein JZ751_011276 [Albula glossodonta]|uniref:TB domain-containing protein n=1 Tax=Albula glossodonta TaxID=121402 RepID=A0A8T2NWT6_9TELE|nr:hypothetical protein JZ751_011276 [Albula glossodonta]
MGVSLPCTPMLIMANNVNECQQEDACGGGQCINSVGSYMCFCTPPMILNHDTMRCQFTPTVSEPAEQHDIYQDICWQSVTQDFTCTRPMAEKKTTYTECCCLYGEAWGMECALCPMKNSANHPKLSVLSPVSAAGTLPHFHLALAVWHCTALFKEPNRCSVSHPESQQD